MGQVRNAVNAIRQFKDQLTGMQSRLSRFALTRPIKTNKRIRGRDVYMKVARVGHMTMQVATSAQGRRRSVGDPSGPGFNR